MAKAARRTAKKGRPPDLPDFARPPLYELVLSIQFGRTLLRNVHMGGLWPLFKKRYPNVEEQAPIAPAFEKFGLPPAVAEPPQFTFSMTPDVLRYWFVSEDRNELLQLQPDRVIHNWRKEAPEAQYPRYEAVRGKFMREIQQIEKFLKDNKLGNIQANQCEVTYINHISLSEVPETQFDRIFTTWREDYSDQYLTHSERAQFAAAYVIPGEIEEPFGRLHVQAQPAIVRMTSERIVKFTLTARGKPNGPSIESAFQWLDKGRYAVVRAFASLTTQEMHQLWGRTDG